MTRRFPRFTGDDHPSPPTRRDQLAGTMFDAPAALRRNAADTSREAAEHMAEGLDLLRRRVLAVYQAHPEGLTPDECAAIVGRSIMAVRPRGTEYCSAKWCWENLGTPPLLRRTGERRRNVSGCTAYVLQITEAGQRQEAACHA